ncbi:MAG: DUF1178 family protein [Hyphomicrobiales bacterium]|nr:MAG: DUF1178 family protein [Hyphomicrobiales bacterium]
MIRYSLKCRKDHAFESWFASSAAYDALAAKKQIACPTCGSRSVAKTLMAPQVVKSEAKSASKRAAKAAAARAVAAQAPEVPGPGAPAAEDVQRVVANKELVAAIRKLRAELQEKSEYVGRRFPEEARKIHHEGVPARGIYGEATAEEAKALMEEGIDFLPLPALPEDHN